MTRPRSNAVRGFTIAELITVCGIIAVLSAIALPVARFGFRRQKEIELRDSIRRVTDAIDKWHDYKVAGRIKAQFSLTQGDYPKELDDLVKPVELLPDGKKVRLLRERDLIDPMTGKKEWTTLSSTDDPDTRSSNEDNIFEVHSKSTALALDGKTHYNEW
jgi:type II secretory pathway pseudopilin PulG